MPEHTPEWEVCDGGQNLRCSDGIVLSARCNHDLEVWIEGDTDCVLRILNAHAGLVEACKAAKAELHCCAGQALARGHGNAGLARVINQLSAALAAVGE